MSLTESNGNGNGNGHKIRASLASMRAELKAKYPDLPPDSLNAAIDLSGMVLNSFTVETRNRLRQIQIKQENFIAGVKNGATVIVTLLCAAGALFLEKVIM